MTVRSPAARVAGHVLAVLALSATVAAQDTTRAPADTTLTDAQKLYGLSLFWQEANYNFAFFDKLPELNWDSLYMAAIPRVLATTTTFDYYQELQRFAARLSDGHTDVSMPQLVAQQYPISYPWILVHRVAGSALVRNVGRTLADTMPIGSEIVRVDGEEPLAYARQHQLPYVSASTEHVRLDEALSRVLLGRPGDSVRIGYVTPSGAEREITLARDRRSRTDAWSDSLTTPPRFTFRWLPDSIAYIEITTFNTDSVVHDFRRRMPELRRARGIIIDVRRNGGGNSGHAYAIASHFTNDTLPTSRWRTRQHVAAFKAWGGDRFREYAEMRAWHPGGVHPPVVPDTGRRLLQPTVVLQDHMTFSAAEDFLVAIDAIPHITTVGRPSNGSTGQPLGFSLPGGGTARIVTKRDTFDDGREFVGIGVPPDVPVEPTVSDVRAGRDVMLERAVEIVRRGLGTGD